MRNSLIRSVSPCLILALGPLAQAQAPSPATAPAPTDAPPAAAAPGPSLDKSLEAARAALKHCKGLDQAVAVSVIDSAGNLKVLLAADGATPRGVQSSSNKARTALAFHAATSELAEKVKTDSSLAAKTADPQFNLHAGGVLLDKKGEIWGAVGVGGAKGSEKDEACAKVAAAKLL
jgi:uncharacterized protein GlcG (DUF336 family)